MRVIAALGLVVAMAGPLQGEQAGFPAGFDVDFDALFAAHASRVQTPAPEVQHLEMPGPVIITRRMVDGRAQYQASDMSGQGAVACAMSVMLDVLVLAGHCPDVLDRAAITRLEGLIHAHGVFMAQNTYPPVPAGQVAERLKSMVRARDAATAAYDCPLPDAADSQVVDLARAITSPRAVRRMQQGLSRPRLPVLHPCL